MPRRKNDLDARTAPTAVDAKLAMVRLDRRLCERQAETGAVRLGGEERLEEVRLRSGIEARAVVHDRQDGAIAPKLGLDRDGAAARRRVGRIVDHGKDDLAELCLVAASNCWSRWLGHAHPSRVELSCRPKPLTTSRASRP